jgi:hypothetical protein
VQNTCGYTGKTGVAGCCNTPADCPVQSNPCVMNTCTANQCGTMVIAGCNPDLSLPPDLLPPPDLFGTDGAGPPQDLSVPDGGLPPDAAAPSDLSGSDAEAVTYSLTGGGGCAAGGRSPQAPWVIFVLLLLCFRVRRT